jgi:hypothetical protein
MTPTSVGDSANPAAARRRSRSAAGCGPTRGSVIHFTTRVPPTIQDSWVWSTPMARSEASSVGSQEPAVTRKPSSTADLLRSLCNTASPAPSPAVDRVQPSPDAVTASAR